MHIVHSSFKAYITYLVHSSFKAYTPGVRLDCCPLSAPVLPPGDVAADGGRGGEEAAQHQQGEHQHRVQRHHGGLG